MPENGLALFIYRCQAEDCGVTFGVSEDFEDQSVVTCPVCGDGRLKDVGELAGVVQEVEG